MYAKAWIIYLTNIFIFLLMISVCFVLIQFEFCGLVRINKQKLSTPRRERACDSSLNMNGHNGLGMRCG